MQTTKEKAKKNSKKAAPLRALTFLRSHLEAAAVVVAGCGSLAVGGISARLALDERLGLRPEELSLCSVKD